MSRHILILIFYFTIFWAVSGSLELIRSFCQPASMSTKIFRRDVISEFDFSTDILYEFPNPRTDGKVNLVKSPFMSVVIKKLLRFIDPKEKESSLDMQKVSVKQFRVTLKNKNSPRHLAEVAQEVEIWSQRAKSKDFLRLLEFYGCYYQDTVNDELDVYLLIQEFTEQLSEDPSGRFPEHATTFRKADRVTRLKTYEAIALQLQDLHKMGFVHNDLQPRHIFMQSFTKEEMKGKYENFNDFGVIFWGEKFQLPNIADFHLAGVAQKKFKPSGLVYNDYETLDSEKGSVLNDIWNLGMVIAELELGHDAVRITDQEATEGGFKSAFRSAFKQRKMNQRDKILRTAVVEHLHFGVESELSFAALLQAMLRIKQKDRIQNVEAVINWLRTLQDFYLNDRRLEQYREKMEHLHIAQALPNIKKIKYLII